MQLSGFDLRGLNSHARLPIEQVAMRTSTYRPIDCAVPEDASVLSEMAGESAAMERLRSQLRRIGPYFRTALIRGEAGTGKEVAARMLHACSPAAAEAFTILAPANALTPHGTIYVNEVGELPLVAQGDLLRMLERLERGRGPAEPVRVIASTSHDLRILATTGRFRQDLYARIATIEVTVPALRERLEDLPALVRHFAESFQHNAGYGFTGINEAALECLRSQLWPGNVRELEGALRAAAAAACGGVLEPRHLAAPPAHGGPLPHARLDLMRLQDVVDAHVLRVLQHCEGNKLRTAELLGISRSTLYRMLEAYTALRAGAQ